MMEEENDSLFTFYQDLDLYKVTISAESCVMNVSFLSLCPMDTVALHRIQSVDSASIGQLAPSPMILLLSLSGPNM